MAPHELARIAAQTIVDRVAHQPAMGPGHVTPVDIAYELILGAINRSLEEAARASAQEIVHTHTPALGGVDVKVTKSTQGVSLEVDCKRPRETGESWDDAAAASARLVAAAYSAALEEIVAIGLTPGKESRP